MAYKLTYFDARGRAEPMRLIFALTGQQFEDKRIKHEEWATFKQTAKLPWDQVPILQVGDKTIAQSGTIVRFLGRRFNLMGASEFDAAKVEELIDALGDVQAEWVRLMFLEKDESKKVELKKNLLEQTLPKYLGKLEKIQAENGGNFLVGPSVTLADVCVASGLESLQDTVAPNLLDKYPNLKKMKTAFFAIPNVKAYVDKRPPQ